jgi:hypothetical protein
MQGPILLSIHANEKQALQMTDSITEVGVVSDFFRIEDLSPLIVASAVCSQTPFLARVQELWRLVLLRAGWDGGNQPKSENWEDDLPSRVGSL